MAKATWAVVALVMAAAFGASRPAAADSVEQQALAEHLEQLEEEREVIEDRRTTRHSTGAMATGITLMGVGGVAILAGGVTALASCEIRGAYEGGSCDGDQAAAGGAIAAAGLGTLLFIGLPLTIYGKQPTHATLELSPTGASLRGHF